MLQFPQIPSVKDYDDLFHQIEVLSQAITHIPFDSSKNTAFFHRQVLKSSLFSARIEGNTLSLPAVEHLDLNSKEKQKKEVSNTLKALNYIQSLPAKLSVSSIKKIHALVLDDLDKAAGKLRKESSAIFDQFGNVVYLTPSPEEMEKMLDVWFSHAKGLINLPWKEQVLMVVACHYYFEKIHPFIDGNGRTGRVVMQYQLQQVSQFKDVFLPVDQYFDEHKSEYYYHLEKNSRNIENFVTFFLQAIKWSLQQILNDIKATGSMAHAPEEKKPLSELLPRRQEVLLIIKDHPLISLDMLARRFPTISKRTLTYDVQQLTKFGLVQKHGSTRGVVYSAA